MSKVVCMNLYLHDSSVQRQDYKQTQKTEYITISEPQL